MENMIKTAKTAGFCYGVKRAVDSVYEKVAEGEKIATLGALIHNRQVVDDLKNKGVFVYDNVSDVPKGVKLVIRTHGVGKYVIDEIKQRGIEYIDLTCPFVAKIHNIVREYYDKNYQIIIVGDENHPEVKGINGWCNNSAYITYSYNDKNIVQFAQKNVCVVAQTTINREIFEKIVQFIKKTCKSTLVFDTICNATKYRQAEAESLSAESDIMFVIGGLESSNTRKLYEISKSNCELTYHIETFEDIPQNIYYKNKKIGITAGASTPSRIIEEVFTTMEEKNKNEVESFAEMFEQSEMSEIRNGDIVEGTIVEVKDNEAIVELAGFKFEGQLLAEEVTDDPNAKLTDILKKGETIKVVVKAVLENDGKVVLSRKRLVLEENWNKMQEAFENKTVLEGKIIKAVKGGVIALTDGTQVFIPAKHAAERYVQDLTTLIGKEVSFKLIDIDDKRHRVVGSVRVVVEEEKKAVEDKFWQDVAEGKIAEGQTVTGVVKKVPAFGAFVDIGGVDGLVHISELSWNKIKDPTEIVKEGDTVSVYIKSLDPETKKISLGYKKQEDNPWVIAQNKYNVGDVVSCKIVRMMSFGAFAEIIPSVDGLIHISQIADRRIEKPEDVLQIGQVVDAKITDANWETKKISLSIRELIAPKKTEEAEEAAEVAEETTEE